MADTRAINTVTFDVGTLSVYNKQTGKFEDVTLQGRMYTVEGVTDEKGQLRRLSIGELVMALCLERAAEKEAEVIKLMSSINENTNVLNALSQIESELVAGKLLKNITGSFTYNGVKYERADKFLEALGFTFNDTATANQIDALFDWLSKGSENAAPIAADYCRVTGVQLEYRGEDCSTVWEFLLKVGIYNWSDGLRIQQTLVDGGTLSENDKKILDRYFNGWRTFEGNNRAIAQFLANKIYKDLTGDCAKIARARANELRAAGGEYSRDDNDKLISGIESKMDSMNSISQELLIRLQSATNKRDQSYDMITNILKSLNSTLMTNVNNL